MRTIHITASRSYDVVLDEGLLSRAGRLTSEVLPPRRVMVVSDETVFALFGRIVMDSYEDAGFETAAFTFE
ncbi:MAG: 3-dehydroquinate synthase, partial [Oscillospiraceae bacterium]|nr:3-dehydroquinate synthase [Oscillospiraceae bacterium]